GNGLGSPHAAGRGRSTAAWPSLPLPRQVPEAPPPRRDTQSPEPPPTIRAPPSGSSGCACSSQISRPNQPETSPPGGHYSQPQPATYLPPLGPSSCNRAWYGNISLT